MRRQLKIPPADCQLCERLARFRQDNRRLYPEWFNAPVPAFSGARTRLLIVGLAPGLKGANKTGRPFTGDYAGDLLYAALLRFGFASGAYKARLDDSLELIDCSITNAVRCVPPKNKPVAAEINMCRRFLSAEIAHHKHLRAILALGRISHDSLISAFGLRRTDFSFSHGANHRLSRDITLFDSYHCSRYNTNTRRLREDMFMQVFCQIRSFLSG